MSQITRCFGDTRLDFSKCKYVAIGIASDTSERPARVAPLLSSTLGGKNKLASRL